MIVADTNVVAALFLASPHTPLAEALFMSDDDWMVPRLWRCEMRSVLNRQCRGGLMTADTAKAVMGIAEERFGTSEMPVISAIVLDLAMQSGCTPYDCEFVALALDLGVKLVTADKQVLAAFPDVAVALGEF